ncbi:hypothetical protein GALL_387910 [mine drainage metagenome]|uniref:Uncharacterized protein n=1 Tax=mine drainage metagenome TaxID=410659 RepID=A0A1J5QHJ2_9ZZZZ
MDVALEGPQHGPQQPGRRLVGRREPGAGGSHQGEELPPAGRRDERAHRIGVGRRVQPGDREQRLVEQSGAPGGRGAPRRPGHDEALVDELVEDPGVDQAVQPGHRDGLGERHELECRARLARQEVEVAADRVEDALRRSGADQPDPDAVALDQRAGLDLVPEELAHVVRVPLGLLPDASTGVAGDRPAEGLLHEGLGRDRIERPKVEAFRQTVLPQLEPRRGLGADRPHGRHDLDLALADQQRQRLCRRAVEEMGVLDVQQDRRLRRLVRHPHHVAGVPGGAFESRSRHREVDALERGPTVGRADGQGHRSVGLRPPVGDRSPVGAPRVGEARGEQSTSGRPVGKRPLDEVRLADSGLADHQDAAGGSERRKDRGAGCGSICGRPRPRREPVARRGRRTRGCRHPFCEVAHPFLVSWPCAIAIANVTRCGSLLGHRRVLSRTLVPNAR